MMLEIAMRQQAVDFSCVPEDFCLSENKVVISKENLSARRWAKSPSFCKLTSFGGSVVAAVHADIAQFVLDYISERKIEDCFSPPGIFVLNDELRKHGRTINFSAEYYLPDIKSVKPISCDYEMKTMQPVDFAHLYDTRWSNALGNEQTKHSDMLAVGAYDGSRLVGLASCGAESADMWQIGFDVLPDYRGKGIASAITSRLTIEILKLEKVPYTGRVWANIPSFKTSLNSGFKPVWIEMATGPI